MAVTKWLKVYNEALGYAHMNGCWESTYNILTNEGQPLPHPGKKGLRTVLYNLRDMAEEANTYILKLLIGCEPLWNPADPEDKEITVWSEHKQFPREDWESETRNGDTNQGYWMWVVDKIQEREDEE